MAPNLIPISKHPSNGDRSARLAYDSPNAMRDIYSVKGGFVACIDGMFALEGLFPSIDAAKAGQRAYLDAEAA